MTRDGRLQLVSLKTLPPVLLSESPAGDQKTEPDAAKTPAQKPEAGTQAVYRHAVELVVAGSYADIAAYMSQLEQLPWQLFWANAQLSVDKHPTNTLRLTLFTLSFDKSWLNI